jgi:hypothetical protein
MWISVTGVLPYEGVFAMKLRSLSTIVAVGALTLVLCVAARSQSVTGIVSDEEAGKVFGGCRTVVPGGQFCGQCQEGIPHCDECNQSVTGWTGGGADGDGDTTPESCGGSCRYSDPVDCYHG